MKLNNTFRNKLVSQLRSQLCYKIDLREQMTVKLSYHLHLSIMHQLATDAAQLEYPLLWKLGGVETYET
jgi:hypothetical protein